MRNIRFGSLSMEHSNTAFESLICFGVRLAILERSATMAMGTRFGCLSSEFISGRC